MAMLAIQRPFFLLLDYESSSAAHCVQNLTIFKSLGEVIHLGYAAWNYYASSHFFVCQPSLVTIANSLSFTFYGCKSTTSSLNRSGHTDLTDVDGPGLRLRYYSVSLRASRLTWSTDFILSAQGCRPWSRYHQVVWQQHPWQGIAEWQLLVFDSAAGHAPLAFG